MILAVANNPYRILGVFTNATRKEIEQNFSKISRMSAAKKSVSFPGDMTAVLGVVDRGTSGIKNAKAKLESSKDRLRSSFFWLLHDSSSIDAVSSIDRICGGQLAEALRILDGGDSLHANVNSAFVALLRDNVDVAITRWYHVFETETLMNELIDQVCGEDFSIDKEDCKLLFLEALFEEYGPVNLFNLIKGKHIPDHAESEIALRARNEYVGEIEELLIKYPVRKERPSFEILFFAENLLTQSEPILATFASFCGEDKVTYRIYADKIASRLNLLVVSAYNEAFRKKNEESIDELEIVGPNSADILRKINRDQLSAKIAKKIEENLAVIERDTAQYVRKREEEREKERKRKEESSHHQHLFNTNEQYVNEIESLLAKYCQKQGKTSFEILYSADNLLKMTEYLLLDYFDFCREDKSPAREYTDKVAKHLLSLVIAAYRDARRKKEDDIFDELQIVGPNALTVLRKINREHISPEVVADIDTNLQYIENDLAHPPKKKAKPKPETELESKQATEAKAPKEPEAGSQTSKDDGHKTQAGLHHGQPESYPCALCGIITPEKTKRQYKKLYSKSGGYKTYTFWDIDVPICLTCQEKETEYVKRKRIGEIIVVVLAFAGVLFFIDNADLLVYYVAIVLLSVWFIAPIIGGGIGWLLLLITKPKLALHKQRPERKYPPIKQARKEGFWREKPWW